MVEVLIGLGIIIGVFWLIFGPWFAKYICTEGIGYRWLFHLLIAPWYLVGIGCFGLLCYTIGGDVLG